MLIVPVSGMVLFSIYMAVMDASRFTGNLKAVTAFGIILKLYMLFLLGTSLKIRSLAEKTEES
jgi:hypothetical protein